MKMIKIVQLSVLTLVLFIITACRIKNDNQENNNQQQNQLPIEESLNNKTIAKQSDIELSNVKITANGAINIVKATIKNNGTTSKTFDAVLYLKNKSGLILGKVSEKVESLASRKEKEISIEIIGDYTTVETYELIVENLLNK
jgi:uncharacterized protein YcfL